MSGPDYSETFAAWQTVAEFSAFLKISESAVRARLADQTFVREGRLIDTRRSLENYIGRLREQASKIGTAKGNADLDAEKLRVQRETAEKLAIANAKARGDLLDAAAVAREWSSILRDVRASILATPARIGSRLPHLSPHDIQEINRELAAALSDLAEGASDAFDY